MAASKESMRKESLLKTNAEMRKVKEILEDPVKWSYFFAKTYDKEERRVMPWKARWYQGRMMRDKSLKKVYRCGRRVGKTETMVEEMLHKTNVNKFFRVLVITPYESQIRLIFMKINEILSNSPVLNATVKRNVKNPFQIDFYNGSCIIGFTTGASSGTGGASIRGQSADWLFLDEVDYMSDQDFDTVLTIAGERSSIGITMSSTPTGRRGKFYQACTDPRLGFREHYYPSMCLPDWGPERDAEFRALLSEQGYVHEIEANFGSQNAGVFNKDKLDQATKFKYYAYNELSYYQKSALKALKEEDKNHPDPEILSYSLLKRPPLNAFRTVGVDWDKYGDSSSILVLEYNLELKKFMVLKRITVPKSEYSYDTAVNLIIEVNEIYSPSWIYCDAGAGDYQIERLHIYGDEHPETGLKNKVVRRHFKQNLEILDPITKEMVKKPLKQFMVEQLKIAFERDQVALSPFDEVLHKQLIDYEVIRRSGVTKDPVFTDKDEHFVDALGLAYLAFVLEFTDLVDVIKDTVVETVFKNIENKITKRSINSLHSKVNSSAFTGNKYADPTGDEKVTAIEVPLNFNYNKGNLTGNYSRFSSRNKATSRSMW